MKEIPGYEGLYAITSCGKVWSYRRKKFLATTLRGGAPGKRYLIVNLFRNNKPNPFYVHRLVAEAYIPNPKGLPEIDHLDGDKSNNSINNLEWVTHKINVYRRFGLETRARINKSRSRKIGGE